MVVVASHVFPVLYPALAGWALLLHPGDLVDGLGLSIALEFIEGLLRLHCKLLAGGVEVDDRFAQVLLEDVPPHCGHALYL